jgi:hypothetical protein
MDGNPPADSDSVANCGGNAGTYFCAQKYALIKLLQQTDASGAYVVADNVGVGLMMYGSSPNAGGYIRFGVRRMNAINRAALIKLLKSIPIADSGSSQQDYGNMMWEGFVFRWRRWRPVVIDDLGSDPDKWRGRGYRQTRLPGERHHGFRVLVQCRRQLCLYLRRPTSVVPILPLNTTLRRTPANAARITSST